MSRDQHLCMAPSHCAGCREEYIEHLQSQLKKARENEEHNFDGLCDLLSMAFDLTDKIKRLEKSVADTCAAWEVYIAEEDTSILPMHDAMNKLRDVRAQVAA